MRNKVKCQLCGEMFMKSTNYGTYIVKEAVKPPRTPHRWKDVGYACDPCGDKKGTYIDKWAI